MHFCIKGGKKLYGETVIHSAKNSILPIIAACVLTKETVLIKNCPRLSDIVAMTEIIKSIGGQADFCGNDIVINCRDANSVQIERSLTSGIRSSVFILGSLISRFKQAKISYPGGCEIGKRPIDLHIEGLSALGVKTNTDGGIIDCDGRELKSGDVRFKLPSVGATENVMMAATLASGMTTISNAAKEPEIIDLANFINSFGGKIYGAGTSTIIVEGVEKLGGGEYTPIPDRIITGTYLAACALTGGKIHLTNTNFEHIYSVIDKLQEAGCRFSYKKNSITISSSGSLSAVQRISTMPYPGFPTDMQPQLVAALSTASGKSIVVENLFESRFKYASQLKKMGADIEVVGTRAVVTGVASLNPCEVDAQDLRGGAALIMAGLKADGLTVVNGAHHVDRGYYKIEDDLKQLGANITRNL